MIEPCPLCGSPAKRDRYHEQPWSEIICTGCGIRYGPYNDLDDGWELMVKAWNDLAPNLRAATMGMYVSKDAH